MASQRQNLKLTPWGEIQDLANVANENVAKNQTSILANSLKRSLLDLHALVNINIYEHKYFDFARQDRDFTFPEHYPTDETLF